MADTAKRSGRAGVLELAVLGLLHESPMHGYELRKRLNAMLGTFRAFSYGSLYPCLKEMLAVGHVSADGEESGARSRIVYKLTADGRRALAAQRRDWSAYLSGLRAVILPEKG